MQEIINEIEIERTPKELSDWVESKIASRQLGSWSHAIEWGLTLLRETFESKK